MTGKEPQGPRRPTSRDVAAAAGVGQATVSRVLTNDPHVSEATRKKVISVLRELNYVPNDAARTMKTGRTDNIGVVVSRLSNPRYPQILDALGEELWTRGLNLTVWNSEHGGDLAARRAIDRRSVDGIVLATATTRNASLWQDLAPGSPVVMVNRVVAELPFDSVAVDDFDGAREVARYLLANGRYRVGCITGDPTPSTIHAREDGFLSEMAAARQVVPDEMLLRGDYSHDHGRTAIRALLRHVDPPTAVFCTNDLLALGAADGLRSLGKAPPDDVWLVGFDDIDMAAWEAYQLTTVRLPIKRMVGNALDLLHRRLTEPERPIQRVWLPARLIVRASTGHAAPP